LSHLRRGLAEDNCVQQNIDKPRILQAESQFGSGADHAARGYGAVWNRAQSHSRARNLRITGSRPVKNLPQAFPHAFDKAPQGESICMRAHYKLDGSPVDEECYGFMTTLQTIPSSNLRFQISEYPRMLLMVHSMGRSRANWSQCGRC